MRRTASDCALYGLRNRAQKQVIRARIVLSSADRVTVADVARHAGVGRPAVWRWQLRFVEAASMACCTTACHPQARQTAIGAPTDDAGARTDLRRSARRSDPRDRPRDGGCERRQLAFGATDLGGARPAAT